MKERRRQPRHGRWHELVVARAGPELPSFAAAAGEDAPAALLFMRRPPGNYVFCGRLETAQGAPGAVRLVDAAALRQGSTFHQLVGCRLREAPPRA